jgi:hypothetical protein
MRLRVGALLWTACAVAGLSMACVTSAAAPQATRERVVDFGVNLEGVSDWSRLSPFVDLMKSSRVWGLPSSPWIHEVRTDAQGWPLEDAGVVVKVIQNDAGDPRADSRQSCKPFTRATHRGRTHGVVAVSASA